MKAIELSLNGKVLSRAGLPEDGNLSAILNLIAEPKGSKANKRWHSSIILGGLSIENQNYHFLNFARKNIAEEDCIQLRIVEVSKPSRPKTVRTETKAERLKAKRKYLKQVAKELNRKA
jgi:hypothetical protein